MGSIGLGIYPTVSNYYYSLVHRQTIADYKHQVSDIDKKKSEAMIEEAREYNRKLLASGRKPYQLDEDSMEEYNTILNVTDTGIMGYIRIPAIKVFLPIYHGTEEDILQVGAGHLASSSLPVGGKGTHSVITGHSGLRSKLLFTDLDKLDEGDTFTINVLEETLTYEVDQILVVEPGEVDALMIDPEKDFCTLVTCTPYGVNTHRLLVRGHRIPNVETSSGETFDTVNDDGPVNDRLYAVAVIGIVMELVFWIIRKRSRKEKK